MNNCLFCNQEEGHGYHPEKEIDFICSRCVQILLSAEQLHLKRAYDKAISKVYENKAHAIESFLIPEDRNGKQVNKRRIEKHFDGKRINRAARFKKISTGKSKIRKKVTLFENKQDIKTVS
jgi:hypothetical protein